MLLTESTMTEVGKDKQASKRPIKCNHIFEHMKRGKIANFVVKNTYC